MNDEPDDLRAAAGESVVLTPPQLWDSDTYWDGAIAPLQVRRAELLTPGERSAWFSDLRAWVDWLVEQYRLANTLYPCWPRHGALSEELQALWVSWQAAWLTGTDPEAPSRWHSQLDQALDRISRRWQFGGCTASAHEAPVAIPMPFSAPVNPDNTEFAPHMQAVMAAW